MRRVIPNFSGILLVILLLLTARICAIEIIEASPQNGSVNNLISTQVSFKVVSYIDTIDIDRSSVEIDINGTIYHDDTPGVSWTLLGQYAGTSYRFIIPPTAPFAWGDSVNVTVNASSYQGIVMAPYSWNFWVIDDNINPWVWNQLPESGEIDVDTDVDILFDITDGLSGVSFEGLSVHLVTTQSNMDEIYEIGANLTYLPITGGYRFTLDPDEDFSIADTVTVTVTVYDDAGNETVEGYSFYVISSFNYTYTGVWVPYPDQTNVPIGTTVRFNIYNTVPDVYVDTLTIFVQIQGQAYSYANQGSFELEPINNASGVNLGYQVTILPNNAFNYNQLVLVAIDAEDTDGNHMSPCNYSFRTWNDITPPYIDGRSPYPNETGVPIDTEIYFTITDARSGVDMSSVAVWIDSSLYTEESESFVTGEITNGYEITITPYPFSSLRVVPVVITGADFLGNVVNVSYQFTCELESEDEDPPFLWDIYPEDGAVNIPLNDVISCYVYDSEPGVNPAEIQMRKNGNPVEATIEPDSTFGITELGYYRAYHVTYQLNEPIPIPITWSIRAEDYIGNVYNDNHEEFFSFSCAASLPPYINLPTEFVFLEDDELLVDFSLYADDPDGAYPTITPAGQNHIIIEIDENEVTFSAPLNWSGSETVTFTVSDQSGGFASDTATIRVIAVNDPPTIDIPDAGYTLVEDTELAVNFAPYVSDVDGDALFLQATEQENVIISITGLMVTISAEQDWFGIENVTFTVFDNSSRLSASETIQIEFTSVDEPPVFTLPNFIILVEDVSEVVDFAEYIYEPEGQPVSISLQGGATGHYVDVENDGTLITFTPDANWHGEDPMTFIVSDGSNFVSDNTIVRVISVNDAPVMNLPASVQINEDESLVLNFGLYVNDVDGDPIILSNTTTDHIAVEIDSMQVTLVPEADWNGTENIYMIAQDPFGASVISQLHVIVDPVNDAPVINFFLPYFEFNEDTVLEVDLNNYITDIDNDNLTINIAGNDNITDELEEMNLTLSAPENWNGWELFYFDINDGMGGVVDDSIQVYVLPVNDAPVMQLPESISFAEDGELQVNFIDSVFVWDIDEDDITIMTSGNNRILTQVVEDIVIFTAELNWNGSEDITFLAIDGHGGVSSGIMEVIVTPVNDSPTINLPGLFTFAEGTELNINLEQYINDVDLDDMGSLEELILSCSGNDNVLVEINDLEVTFSSEPDWNGEELVTFTVTDFELLAASDAVTVRVSIWQNNHPPELYHIQQQNFAEDDELIVDFVADSLVIDIDGDDLLISIVNNVHIQAEIDGSEVRFTADENWNGPETINFFADDQNGGFVYGQLDFFVAPVDDVPILDMPTFFSFQEGDNLIQDINQFVTEVDGDELSLSWEGNDEVDIDIVGPLTINMEVTGSWTGTEEVTFTVSDGITPVSDIVSIIVTLGSGNHAPEFVNLPTLFEFNEDESLDFDFEPYIEDDDDDDEFILTVSNNSFIQYTIIGLEVILYAAANWNGQESLIFTVYDTSPSGSRAFATAFRNVTVHPVNDAPTINLPVYLSFEEDGELTQDFSSFINDVDGGIPELSGEDGDNVFIDIYGSTVHFTATADWFGADTLYFSVSDGEEAATDSLEIRVTEGTWNNPPVIVNLPDSLRYSEDESLTVDFNPFIYDDDGDELLVTFAYNAYIGATVNDNVVTFRSATNWNGTQTLSFTVHELRSRLSADGEIDVIVDPVNDAPVINLPLSIDLEENDNVYISFSNYISDVDEDNLSLTVSENDTIFIEILSDDLVHIVPLAGWHGTETVTFTVWDASLSSSDVVDIVVTQGSFNHDPVIELPDSITTFEDSMITVDFTPYITDIDGDELVLQSEHSENMAIVIEGLEVRITPVLNWHGNENINFTVYDTQRERSSDTDHVLIIVQSVNDAPEMDLPGEFTFEENGSLEVNFGYYLYDADGDFLTITWSGNDNVNIARDGYTITLSSSGGWSGNETVEFTATDGPGLFARDSVEIIVNTGHFNHPPEMTLPGNFTLAEDEPTEFDFGPYLYDDDGDQFILTAVFNPNIAVVIVDTIVTFRPAINYFGTETISFTVYDTGGGGVFDSGETDVIVTPVNDPPTIDLPNSFTISNLHSYSVNFAPFINDPDDEEFVITCNGNSEIEVTTETYPFIIFDAPEEFSGTEIIIFTVTDSYEEFDSDDVQVQVISGSVNTPPVIDLPPQFIFDEDNVYEVDFEDEGYISDVDLDPLSLLVYGNDHISVEILGTAVTLTPDPNWNGSEELTFYVFDDGEGRETAWDDVEVVVNPVNDAPVISFQNISFSFAEGDSLLGQDFRNYYYDVDEDELTLSVSGDDFVNVIIYSDIIVNFSADQGFTGPDTLTFTVSDGNLQNSDDVVVTVEPGNWNHAPVFNQFMPDPIIIVEDSEYYGDFSAFIDDADFDDIVLTVGSVDNVDIIIDVLEVRIIPDLNWFGSTEITFTAYDTIRRASATRTIDLIVQPQNDAPVLNLPDYPNKWEFEENSQLLVNFGNYMSDVDGDLLTISWTGNQNIIVEQGLAYNINFREIDWTGTEMITFTVRDDSLASATDSVYVEIYPGQWNHAPYFEGLPGQFVIDEDIPQQFDFGQYINDDDVDDLLIVTANFNPDILVTVAQDTLVTLTPALNFNGSTTVTFNVIDNVIDRAIASANVEIIVNAINDAPTINLPEEFSMTQEGEIDQDFAFYIDDVDGGYPVLSCEGAEHLNISVYNGSWVNITPVDTEWFGSETITFNVTDTELAASDSMVIRVYQGSTNEPPVFNLPASITFDEDEELVIDFLVEGYIYDEEGDELTLAVNGADHITVEFNGTEVTFSADANWNGIETLQFLAFDDMGRSTATGTLDIIVTPVNDAPVINLPLSFSLSEDVLPENIFLASYISDIDSQFLELTVSGEDNLEIQVDSEYLFIEVAALGNWVGQDTLTFTVSDGSLESSDEAIIEITSGEDNHPPEINLPENFILLEDDPTAFNFSSYLYDPEGDDFVISVGNYPNLSFDINNLNLLVTITPSANWSGSRDVRFTVHDTRGRESDYDNVLVVVEPVNDAPVMSLPDEGFSFEENSDFDISFSQFISDVDGDNIVLSWDTTQNIIITKQGLQVYFSAPDSWYGEEMVTFHAADASTSVQDSVLVVVTQGDWNHDPEFVDLPANWTMPEDTQLVVDFSPYLSDIDGDELELYAAYNSHIDIMINEAVVTFIPDADYNGSQVLEFRLVDLVGGVRSMVSATATLIVTPVNDAPTINLPDNELGFVQSGQLWMNFNQYIDDIDNTNAELSLDYSGNVNIGINIDDENLIVNFWLENDDWSGMETITFTVSDDSLTAEDTVDIRVYQGNINTPPEINLPVEGFSFPEDMTLQRNFAALGYISDEDDDQLYLTVSGNINVTVSITGTFVNFGALADWSDSELLTFWVIDEIGQAESGQVVVTVTPVNDAPVIEFPETGFTFEESGHVIKVLNDYFYDVDSNNLELTYEGADSVIVEIETSGTPTITYIVTFTGVEGFIGTDTISFTVTDAQEAWASDDVDIHVTTGSWNHAPEIFLPEEFSFDEDEEFFFDLTEYIRDVDGDYILIYPEDNPNINISIDADTIVTLTPAENWFGTETIGFMIHDSAPGTRESAYDEMQIHVESVNDPPVINFPPIIEFEENTTEVLNFGLFANDQETDVLGIGFSGNDTIQVQIQGYNIILSAPLNWTGEEVITFTATDDSLVTVEDSPLVRVTMGNWNHPPEIDLPAEGFTLAEDTEMEVDFTPYISDDDEDDLIITSIQDPDINISIIGNLVTFEPDSNYNGTKTLTFTVIDNISRLQDTGTVQVAVTPVNDPPTIVLPPELSISVDTPKSFDFSPFISDIDAGDTYTLTCEGNVHIQVDIVEPWVNMVSSWIGSEWISFRVTDGSQVTATDSMEVFVYASQANNDPEINLPETFSFDEDGTLQIDFNQYLYDADDDDLSLLVTGNNAISVYIAPNEVVNFSAASNWFGSEMLNFIVYDSYSFSIDNVIVEVLPVNDAPTLNLPNGFNFTEGSQLNIPFELYMNDVDDDPLQITFSGNVHLVITPVGTTVQLSCDNWWGEETITFTVDDSHGETASDDVLITISEGVNNHAPVFEDLPASFDMQEDQVFNIDMSLYISDLDGDQLYLFSNGSEHLSVSIYVHEVYINPDDNWNGEETILFTLIDNVRRETVTASSNFIVSAVNDDPVINLPTGGFAFNENGSLPLDFNIYTDDIDNDQLVLECTGNENITVQINNLSVFFTVAQYWNGTEQITFTVDDGNQGTAADEVNVTVNPVNNPPYVAEPIENFSMNEDTTNDSINLNNVFDDHDLVYGDNLTYIWYDDINLQVSMLGGLITITPDPNWFGDETLTFRATDNQNLYVQESVAIHVNSINDLPIVVTNESITAQADSSGYASVWLDANGSWDVDGQIVSVLWSWDGGSVMGMITEYDFAAEYYVITVQATDNQGGVGTATVYLSVAEYGNQCPVASDDYYDVYENDHLTILASSGVLDNDYDPDNYPGNLTAVLIDEPDEGNLDPFNPNGSFIYFANNITNHIVTFTYQAFDEQAYSQIVTVHITVHEIVLDDAVISVGSYDPGGMSNQDITIPILTSELIDDWDVRSFEFDLQFTDGIVQYLGYNLEGVFIDTLGSIEITQTRGNLHCTYSSSEIISGEGALLNIDFHYYLGFSPLQITGFYFNQTEINHVNFGAVNNHFPDLFTAIEIDSLFEDFGTYSEDLDPHFTDADGDDLIYSVVDYNEAQISAAINGNLLVLNSVTNWFGTTMITITATDGYTGTQPYIYTFYPDILQQNDPPQITLPDFFSFPEDSSLVVNISDYISDPDYDVLDISWSGETNIIISPAGMQLTFSSAPDWNGSETVTFQVDDQITGRLIATDDVEINVTPVNDPPVLQLPYSFNFDEDDLLTVNFTNLNYVFDPEGDNIILSLSNNENIFASFEGTIVTLTATENWNSDEIGHEPEMVTFTAVDDQDTLSVSAEILVIVHGVNDAPVIDLPDQFDFNENSTALENTVNFADSIIYDVDGNILELTVNDGEFVNITIVGSIVSFEPVPNWDGSETRVFTVEDNQGRVQASGSVRIYIWDTEPNQPPVITLPAQGITYAEDSQLFVDFGNSQTPCYVSDPEDDDIVLIVGGSENITANVSDLTVTFGTVPNFFGTDQVEISVYDIISRNVTRDTMTVVITPVNDPPEIDLPDNIILIGDTTRVINFGQYLSDVDNDVNNLHLSATGNVHVGIQIFNTVVSFAAPAYWEGEETVYFSVLDQGSIPAQDSLVIIVNQESINHPPQISLPASLTFLEDEILTVDFSQYISDQDEDNLILYATGQYYINVNITDQNFVTLTAQDDWFGQETIIFTVFDSQSRASDSEDIQVNVTAVNDPPRFDPIYDFIMESDQVLEIEFANYVSDIEGNSYYLTLSEGVGLNITQSNTKFTIIPQEECPEIQSLTLTATENTSGIFSEIPFGLHVKSPVVDLEALADAVNSGLFTFYENSGLHIIDFAQFLESSYDITLTSPLTGSPDSDSLDITINGLSVTFTPKNSWIGTLYVPFTATYLYDRARRDFEVKITIRAEKNGEYIAIIPHTVTWKDECMIQITTGERPEDISCKILNRRGRLIQKINDPPVRIGENRSVFFWDKRNTDGNPVDGGLYIYQIDINGKTYQGTIVIAR